MRYAILLLLLFSSFAAIKAQQQTGTIEDSIVQSKVIELVEKEYVLHYYDENINTPGDYIYSSHISTTLRQKPGADFKDYWVQVKDHRKYDDPSIYLNFFVDPGSWEVFYYDTETNFLWTWEHWKKQRKFRKT